MQSSGGSQSLLNMQPRSGMVKGGLEDEAGITTQILCLKTAVCPGERSWQPSLLMQPRAGGAAEVAGGGMEGGATEIASW